MMRSFFLKLLLLVLAFSFTDYYYAAMNTKTEPKKTEVIVLGGGCFWGVEELLRSQKGVVKTDVGYAGGDFPNPTYADMKTGRTGHAEVVRIEFDPKVLSAESLLKYFFTLHDPTTLNQQGNDRGTQYRSIILTTTDEQKKVAEKVKKLVNDSSKWKKPVVTEIVPLKKYYLAEDYHQDYLQKNPGGYTCHYVRDIQF